MAREYVVQPVKTYVSKANVKKAVDKIITGDEFRYIIVPTENGRFFPVFIGMNCVTAGIHFHFNIVA